MSYSNTRGNVEGLELQKNILFEPFKMSCGLNEGEDMRNKTSGHSRFFAHQTIEF